MHAEIVAIALHVFASLGFERSSDAKDVAHAIAAAVESEAAPATGESHAVDAAVLAYYVARESGVRRFPHPHSDDAKAGVSCGILQEPCEFVRSHTLTEQVRWWLASVRAAGLGSVDSSPTRAGKRLRSARRILMWTLVAVD